MSVRNPNLECIWKFCKDDLDDDLDQTELSNLDYETPLVPEIGDAPETEEGDDQDDDPSDYMDDEDENDEDVDGGNDEDENNDDEDSESDTVSSEPEQERGLSKVFTVNMVQMTGLKMSNI